MVRALALISEWLRRLKRSVGALVIIIIICEEMHYFIYFLDDGICFSSPMRVCSAAGCYLLHASYKVAGHATIYC